MSSRATICSPGVPDVGGRTPPGLHGSRQMTAAASLGGSVGLYPHDAAHPFSRNKVRGEAATKSRLSPTGYPFPD